MKLRIQFAVILFGAAGMGAQLVVLREAASLFSGDELSLGLMLGAWLILTAAGSLLATKYLISQNSNILNWFSVIYPCILFGSIWLLRYVFANLPVIPGEVISPIYVLLTSIIGLIPICLLTGAGFVLWTEYARSEDLPVSRTYVLEAVGAFIAGVIFTFLMLPLFDRMILILLVWSFLALFPWLLLRGSRLKQIIIAAIILMLLVLSIKFEKYSFQWLMPGYNVIKTIDTRYNNIRLMHRGAEFSLFSNGHLSVTIPGRSSAEENVAFPILAHDDPRLVLLLESGSFEAAGVILENADVCCITWIGLDEQLFELEYKYIPDSLDWIKADNRLQRVISDGRRFLAENSEKYDVIISGSGEPTVTGRNRYYTYEFFQQLYEQLDENGWCDIALPGGENFINEEQAQLIAIVKHTIEEVFGNSYLIPGETTHILATRADNPPSVYDLTQRIIERSKSPERRLLYTGQYQLPFRLSESRIKNFYNAIDVDSNILNRDLQPVGLVAAVKAAMTRNQLFWAKMLTYIEKIKDYNYLFLPVLLLLMWSIYTISSKNGERLSKGGILVTIAAVGIAEITLEIAVIFSYQAHYGVVFHRLGLVIASYMLGLAFGGWLGERWSLNSGRKIKLVILQALMTILPIGIMLYILNAGAARAEMEWGFPTLTLIAGFIGGAQLPIAASLWGKETRGIGLLYGFDLLGASIGAVLASIIWLTLLGLTGTMYLLVILNGLALILLILGFTIKMRTAK